MLLAHLIMPSFKIFSLCLKLGSITKVGTVTYPNTLFLGKSPRGRYPVLSVHFFQHYEMLLLKLDLTTGVSKIDESTILEGFSDCNSTNTVHATSVIENLQHFCPHFPFTCYFIG